MCSLGMGRRKGRDDSRLDAPLPAAAGAPSGTDPAAPGAVALTYCTVLTTVAAGAAAACVGAAGVDGVAACCGVVSGAPHLLKRLVLSDMGVPNAPPAPRTGVLDGASSTKLMPTSSSSSSSSSDSSAMAPESLEEAAAEAAAGAAAAGADAIDAAGAAMVEPVFSFLTGGALSSASRSSSIAAVAGVADGSRSGGGGELCAADAESRRSETV